MALRNKGYGIKEGGVDLGTGQLEERKTEKSKYV